MLNYEYPPLGGGAANATYHLLSEFAKYSDIHIDLVTSSANNKHEIENFSENINIYKLKINKSNIHYWNMSEIVKWTWDAYFSSKKLIKNNKYDLCHCWFGWPCGLLGYYFKKKNPYLVALRGSDIPGYNPRLKLLDTVLFSHISKTVWKNAKSITTLSKDSSEMAKNTLACNFKVIHNGVNTNQFYPKNVYSDEIKLLFVGRLIERKGVEYILFALEELKKKYTDKKISLTIVGSGNLEDKLKHLTEELNLKKNVSFLGARKHEELPDIYREHDIFILPSINEALGNVTQEAIASGLALLTTETGASELLDENGFIFKKRDSKDIVEKISILIENPEILNSFKIKSAELAKSMSWKSCADSYLQLYKEITQRRGE